MLITPEMALKIRQRGLLLPVNDEYTVPRLKEIAKRHTELLTEFNNLELELERICREPRWVDLRSPETQKREREKYSGL